MQRRLARAAQIRIESERRTLRPRADAVDTLNRLRALGLQTALISNCSPEVPALWMTTPLVQVIDEPLFSCVEGLIKPDPAIYVRACERLGVDARGLRVRGRWRQSGTDGRRAGWDARGPDQDAARQGPFARFGTRYVAG